MTEWHQRDGGPAVTIYWHPTTPISTKTPMRQRNTIVVLGRIRVAGSFVPPNTKAKVMYSSIKRLAVGFAIATIGVLSVGTIAHARDPYAKCMTEAQGDAAGKAGVHDKWWETYECNHNTNTAEDKKSWLYPIG